jgi:glycosyltransferase involved in cell wall biosynthesis
MKVLIMDLASRTHKVGGEERVAAQLFEGLKKNYDTYYLGYDTTFINPEGPNKIILQRKLPVGAGTRKLGISELGVMRMAYNVVFVRRMKWFGLDKEENQAVMAIAPDVIIANSLADYPIVHYLRNHGLTFKSIYIDHGSLATAEVSGSMAKEAIPLTVGTGIQGRDVNEIRRKFFNSFDLNVALNNRQLAAIKKFTKKVAYIPNGLVVPITTTALRKARFMERYGITESSFVVLYVGRMFERQKRVSTLINAFMKIKNPEFRLLLVGHGPSLQDYIRLAKDDHRIVFTSSLPESSVSDAYESSNVLVLPSAWEGFGLVILEAAAHSLPMVLSDGAYVEDLRTKEIGEIPHFPIGDTAKLSKLLTKLYTDKKLLARTASASNAIARKFTAKRTLALYKQAIDSL